jgi:peptidoglycan/LPS O-acetylase OafA/YrhL
MKKMPYRKDINGLRGLAVFAILIFHLDIGLLSGGYVGVDIFFVISGYLISNIIYRESLNGSFSLMTFYERRARRILPALVSTLIICSFFVYMQLFPNEIISYAKSMIASALFSANIYFYSALGYFSPSATEIPLLHLWSLGVEEQFYIIFPLCMMLLARRSSQFLSTALIISILVSLLLSQWMLKINPTAAFYLLPFRAFELLIGAFIAVGRLPGLKGRVLPLIVSSIGLFAILYSLFLFNEETKFPGFSAFLPCLGAALIIWAGEHNTMWSNKMLSINPWQWLGKISYSLYLVHWPIIVFAKRLYPYAGLFNYAASVLALCFILAYTNFYFVEQRFRYLRLFNSQKALMLSAMLISLVVATGSTAIYKKGFPENLTLNTQLFKVFSFLLYDYKPIFRNGTCFQDYDLAPDGVDISSCVPKGTHDKTVMLWGDSHAAHLYSGLKESLEGRGYSFGMLASSLCPPIIGIEIAGRPHCKRFNEIALASILKLKPKLLILSATWPVDDHTMDLLEKTIQRLASENIKLTLIGKSPIYKNAVPILISEQIKKGEEIQASHDLSFSEFQLIEADKKMMKRFGARRDVRYISVINNVCEQQFCPLVTADGTPIYFDTSHLTESGSKLYAKKLTPLILKAEKA